MRGLDLFAGTGALGFELASRGARAVTLIESHPVALTHLHTVRTKLGAIQIEIISGDALSIIDRWPAAAFDLVLLDPPFDAGLGPAALEAARRVLADDGLIYYEGATPLPAEQAKALDLDIVRAGRAGRVAFHLLAKAAA